MIESYEACRFGRATCCFYRSKLWSDWNSHRCPARILKGEFMSNRESTIRTRTRRFVSLGAFLMAAAAFGPGAHAALIINPTFNDASFIAAGFDPTTVHNAFTFAANE